MWGNRTKAWVDYYEKDLRIEGMEDFNRAYHIKRIRLMNHLEELLNIALDDYNDHYSVQLDYRNGKEVVVVTSRIRGSQIININGDSNRGVLIDVMRHLDINKLADGE